MEPEVKERWELLRIFAETDGEFKKRREEIGKQEFRFIMADFSPEQVKILRSLIHAYNAANWRVIELACECMVFPKENKK